MGNEVVLPKGSTPEEKAVNPEALERLMLVRVTGLPTIMTLDNALEEAEAEDSDESVIVLRVKETGVPIIVVSDTVEV